MFLIKLAQTGSVTAHTVKMMLAVFLSLGLSVPASAGLLEGKLTIEEGSYFCMMRPFPAGICVPLTSNGSGDGGLLLNQYQATVLQPNNPDPAIPTDCGQKSYQLISGGGDIVAPFGFFGVLTYVSTNPIAWQSCTPHPAPYADVGPVNPDGSRDLTLDLSAWEVFWNGNTFEQGPRLVPGESLMATGKLYPDNTYEIFNWPARIVGGAFNGILGNWQLAGRYMPTPLVATGEAGPQTLNIKSQGNGFSVSLQVEDTDGTVIDPANVAEGVIISSVGGVVIPTGAITENVSDRSIEGDVLTVAFNDPALGSRQDIIAVVSDAEDGSSVEVCASGSAYDANGILRPFEACDSITILNKGNR